MKRPPIAGDAVAGEEANNNQKAASPTPTPSPVASNLTWIDDPVPGIQFDLELPGGLILRNCSLHYGPLRRDDSPAHADRWWIGLPGHVCKGRDGKAIHAHIVDFADADAQDRILQSAAKAVFEAMGDRPCR